MQIVGAGVGRTGTFSLKLAINRLGLGPCHHMEVVLQNMSRQVPLCDFLEVSPPDEAFPHTNKHEEFWDLVNGAR